MISGTKYSVGEYVYTCDCIYTYIQCLHSEAIYSFFLQKHYIGRKYDRTYIHADEVDNRYYPLADWTTADSNN
jgi:hypothetical protein